MNAAVQDYVKCFFASTLGILAHAYLCLLRMKCSDLEKKSLLGFPYFTPVIKFSICGLILPPLKPVSMFTLT